MKQVFKVKSGVFFMYLVSLNQKISTGQATVTMQLKVVQCPILEYLSAISAIYGILFESKIKQKIEQLI